MSSDILKFYKLIDFDYKLQFLPVIVSKDDHSKKYSDYIDSVSLLADGLSSDKNNFDDLLRLYLKSNKDKDLDILNNYVKDYYEEIKQRVIEIPNNINKAYDILRALIEIDGFKDEYQVYDAFVLLKDKIDKEKIEEIFSYWEESGDEIWVSRDFMETIDTVSHYRFNNIFGFDCFDSIFEKEEFELQFRLLENIFSEDIKSLAFDLWIMDRIPDFTNYNRDLISFILKFVSRSWNSEGFWESNIIKTIHERVIEDEEDFNPSERKIGEKNNIKIGINSEGKETEKIIEWEPSNYITALLSLNLLRHPVSDEMGKMGLISAKWLSKNQNSDGSWSDFDYSQDIDYRSQDCIKFSKGAKFKPDLFITLIAIEVIFRSDISNKDRYVKKGFKWVKEQQNELGYWDAELFYYPSFPLVTVLVLELERLIGNDTIIEKSDYLNMSKDFLNSSIRFLSDESLNSRRLAVITAYHGIEFFLYHALTENDINIFDRSRTIGMYKALNKFEKFLVDKNIIVRGSIIDFKNSLHELRSYRDDIIHRGYSIEKSKCEKLVANARKFISKYSSELWNIDILD